MNLVEAQTKDNLMGKNGAVRKVIAGMTGKGGPGVKVNSSYDVPYGAGMAKDEKTVYIDHRVPKKLKLVNGKSVDVVKALVAHETAERKAMDKGLRYQEAHKKFAIPAENKEVRSQGASPGEYNKKLGATLKRVESKIDAPEPPDLDPKPYKDTQKLSLLKNLIHKHGQKETKSS